jgi:hypothetical protein
MHEEPQVFNFGRPGTGLKLREGMVVTSEPMVNQGTRKVSTASDGRTVVTSDRKLSTRFEHMVAVTRNGVDVLTLRRDEMPMRERAAESSVCICLAWDENAMEAGGKRAARPAMEAISVDCGGSQVRRPHDQASNLFNELRQRLSALYCQGGEEGTHQG